MERKELDKGGKTEKEEDEEGQERNAGLRMKGKKMEEEMNDLEMKKTKNSVVIKSSPSVSISNPPSTSSEQNDIFITSHQNEKKINVKKKG
jgi:hypothetical protein